MTNWKGEIRTRKRPNREVISVKVFLPPRPKTNTPTDQPECMNDCPNTTTPTIKPHVRINDFTSSLLEQVNIHSISSTIRNCVSPEALSGKRDIGTTTANCTTKVTTQQCVRTVKHPSLQRRFRTNNRQLRYRRLNTTMFTNTYFSSIKSTRGHKCAQIWTNDIKYIRIEPIYAKSHAHHSAKNMFKNDGVPTKIVIDGAREQVIGKFKEACQDTTVKVQHLQYNTHWANRSKGAVRENKRAARRTMKKLACPERLWD